MSRYGAGFGLPPAYSGANNFWLWGPPPAADTSAIAVNVDPALLHREFAHVRQVATYWNGLGVDDDEQGVPVYLATGLKTSWTQAWPRSATTPEVADARRRPHRGRGGAGWRWVKSGSCAWWRWCSAAAWGSGWARRCRSSC